jgi:hypothetical protein
MNADTQKLFRINLLIQARATNHLGLTVNELAVGAKSQGYAGSFSNDQELRDQVRDELQYLIDKKFIEKVPAEVSPEVESFRITASGRDHLAISGI